MVRTRVRPGQLTDLPELAEIWAELMEMHQRTDPHFALADDARERWIALTSQLLSRDDVFVLAAERDRGPIGFCIGWIATNPTIYAKREVGFISEIAVARRAHRQGVGRALVSAVRGWMNARELDELQLSTAVWNDTAQKFWRAMGGAPLLVRYVFDAEQLPADLAQPSHESTGEAVVARLNR